MKSISSQISKVKTESYLLKKIHLTATFLDEIVEEGNFISAGLVRNGKVVTTSAKRDAMVDFHELVDCAAPLMKVHCTNLERVRDFQLCYAQRKVFLQRLPPGRNRDEYWVIVSMHQGRLYFRQVLERKIKKISLFLS